MMRTQRGLSFLSFIFLAIVVALVAVLFMKVIPAYVEFFSIKKAIDNVVRDQSSASPAAIRGAFERQASISNIQAVKPADLIVLQTGGVTKVSANYEQLIPLFANVSLLFDFQYEKSSGSASQP